MPFGQLASAFEERRLSRNLRMCTVACEGMQLIGTAAKPPRKLSRPPGVSMRLLTWPMYVGPSITLNRLCSFVCPPSLCAHLITDATPSPARSRA